MNYPALKGEVSENKMVISQIKPRLRRNNVVSNSFASCISNAPKEFSRAPEMSCSEMFSQPRMLPHQLESRVPLEQLQCPADAHGGWHLNKQVDVVDCNMQFINFESISESCLPDKKFTIHSNQFKFEWVSGIFRFPDKMEGILPECMFSTCQVHFFAPQTFIRSKVLTKMFDNLVHGDRVNPHFSIGFQELNIGGRIPPVLESTGILRLM